VGERAHHKLVGVSPGIADDDLDTLQLGQEFAVGRDLADGGVLLLFSHLSSSVPARLQASLLLAETIAQRTEQIFVFRSPLRTYDVSWHQYLRKREEIDQS
jgi:hypothetical protein